MSSFTPEFTPLAEGDWVERSGAVADVACAAAGPANKHTARNAAAHAGTLRLNID